MSRRPATLAEAAEWLFCLAALLLMSEALLGPVFAPDQTKEGPEWLRLVWVPVYGGVAAMAMLRAPRLARVWVGAGLTLALVAWAMASERWSIAPDLTGRRSIALLFTSVFGLLLAARYGWRGLIELFAATFLVLAVGSAVAALAIPEFGVHATIHPGAWRGLWYEKNQLGAAMAKGTLACLCAAAVSPRRRALWIMGLCACAGLVLMSTSKTSLLALLLVLGGAAFIACAKRGGALAVSCAWAAVVVAGAGAAVLLTAPEMLFEALGKDPTLTGRTGIWEALLRRAAVRPWEGYGYGAFWKPELGPAWYVRREVEWPAPTAHNGWLDVLVQLGWIGVALCVAHFAVATIGALKRFGSAEGGWAVLSLALFALFSISESTILQQNNINWVIYVATAAKLLERRPMARRAAEPRLVAAARAMAFVETEWRRPPAAQAGAGTLAPAAARSDWRSAA
jgi:O-antigen ligase